LLAAGLLPVTGVLAGFVVAGAALFTGWVCPAFGLAALCEDEGENFSLIFWIKDVCADALPTSVIANST
jgi:hypothetical protein